MTEAVDLSTLIGSIEEPDAPPGESGVMPSDVPCTIHLKGGDTIKVTKIAAWAYTPQGVFASGRWSKTGKDVDVVIPFDQVRIIELHYDLLKEYILAERAVPEAPTDAPSD